MTVGRADDPDASGDFGPDLVKWGKALRVTTTGRRTGRRVEAVLGFVEESDGSVLVAAGSPRANWARNLLADARCEVLLRGELWNALAERVDGPERARAVVDLILKYGTPSERLGAGPVFRLRPVP